MKNIIALFMALSLTFGGTWAYKSNHAIARTDASPVNSAHQWWDISVNDMAWTDDEWTLDPEIPLNYKPVPGQKNMYMVIGTNGKIQGYRVRERQEDGSWVWHDVNPDIPENYEAVEGLKDVYKVVDEKGNVTYLKYIRNDDDTYAFVEVDEHGNPLLENEPKGDEIPENYKLVTGSIYAVYNDHGVLIGYKQRIVDAEGNVMWRDIEAKALNKNTEEGSHNEDSSTVFNPFIESPINSVEGGNTGATNEIPGGSYTYPQIGGQEGFIQGPSIVYPVERIPGEDGTYTEKETITETKHSGGWKITYETVVTRIYDSNGVLQQTRSDGPYEVSKVLDSTSQEGVSPSSNKESTLNGELTRVSAYVSFDESTASAVVSLLNAERSSAGLEPLTIDYSLTSAAKIYAADMAIYNHADYNTASYGTIQDLFSYYGVAGYPSQNLWKTSGRSAEDIHSRFQTLDQTRNARMSSMVSSVGVAVVEKNGTQCICEVFT